MTIPDFVHDDLAALEITLDEEQLARLADYLGRILDANKRMNLTAIREPDAAWRRLIVDSLSVLPGIDSLVSATGSTVKVVDIGSGAGLPGMPIAIARPDVAVTMLETTGKKAEFIRGCLEGLGLTNAQVLQTRAETAGQDIAHRGKYDAAVSRAVGAMSLVLEYSLPLVCEGGRVLAMKGPRVEQELDEAGDALEKLGAGELAVIEAYPESFENDLVIVSIIKERPTPKAYPRLPGVPKKQPL
ncbi:MAG: 16S rRNA (guanine(527)-N(7))-methyltransferase RsmG [Phycisphaerales bacterium JB063]